MLIIEGADQLGKTTVAKRIVEFVGDHSPAFYAHMTRPAPAFDFSPALYQDRMSLWAVQDRFHLGALVWHTGVMDQSRLRNIERRLDRYKSVTCVFYSQDSFYIDQRSLKGEMFDRHTIFHGNIAYRKMATGDHPMQPHIDITVEIRRGRFLSEDQIRQIAAFWIDRVRGVETPEAISTLRLST